jgi:hypothetical protein
LTARRASVCFAQQGVVIVALWDPSHAVWQGGGPFLTPTRHGAVRVASASGGMMMLSADDGVVFPFDTRTPAFR